MGIDYSLIQIFTSEEVQHKGRPLSLAVVDFMRNQKLAARCLVTRGVAGCYENGEVATKGIEVLSFNMPLKIEILLPARELERVLPELEAMVEDGIVVVGSASVRQHRSVPRLIPRQLRVRDAMTPAPVRVKAETPASEVLQRLLHASYNGLPVVDGEGRPVGMVTQGDLIRRAGVPVRKGLLADCDGGQLQELLADLARKPAGQIMTAPVVTVAEDKTLSAAVDMMVSQKLKRLPVVDGEGRLTGMVSRFDVFKIIGHDAPDWRKMHSQVQVSEIRTVADIMDRKAQTVLPEATMEEIVRVIDGSDVQRVSVVDPKGMFLGLISDKAVLAAFGEHREGLWRHLLGKLPFREIGRHGREYAGLLNTCTARDVLKKDVFTVREDTLIDEAIRLMVDKGIKRLPVLDPDGIFKGMVSRDAVLRAGMR